MATSTEYRTTGETEPTPAKWRGDWLSAGIACLVKKTMERMGGRAWAGSEPGKGATFYLEISK